MAHAQEETGTLDVEVLLAVLTALKQGDFAARMPSGQSGVAGMVADTLNDIIATNAGLMGAIAGVCRMPGREGRPAQRIDLPGLGGGWASIIGSVNTLADDLAPQAQPPKYQSGLLANMSHALRTPLNSLLILARQLADNPQGNLSPRQVEFAKTIHGSGSELLTLINDIVDLSRIESGAVTPEWAEYRFDQLRGELERTFSPMAAARQIGFSVELADALPAALTTDIARLRQVLKNLLANAFQFSSHGQVRLHIGPAAAGWSAAGPMLAFAVRGSGNGITAGNATGNGLGLAIARALARLLGGEIRVDSTPGAGSTFTLLLPYQGAAPDSQPPAPPLVEDGKDDAPSLARDAQPAVIVPDAGLAGHKVLIVDDDMRNIFALSALLERQLMQVVFAESGRAGIDTLRRDPDVEIVLMDIMMPEMDGYDTMRAIRRIPGFETLPLIALTAMAMKGERDKCLAAGASDHITKPVDVAQLLSLMRVWLR